MEVDREKNYYACGGFRHIAYHCRNQGRKVAENRRLEYGGGRVEGINEYLNYLKGVENLESLN